MFGFPGPIGDSALSADAIRIPKGDPGEILGAAAKLRQTARILDRSGRTVDAAGNAAVAAEGWTGYAAFAFQTLTFVQASAMDGGASELEHASGVLRTFAHELRDQQQIARAARRAGRAAEDLANAALNSLRNASSAGIAARQQQATAVTDAATARGTADHAGAVDAHHRECTARAAAGRAQAAENKARAALTDANGGIVRAIKRAEDANERADDAAQRARAALVRAAQAAKTHAVDLGPIPVPVTPTSTANPFAASNPFQLPFRGLTPGDVRRQDIAAAAEAAREAAENKPLNDWQKLGRALFSTGAAPLDAVTFGGFGKAVNNVPGLKGIYSSDAGGAKITKWIGPGVAGKTVIGGAAKQIAKRMAKRPPKPKGPMKPIFPRHPRDTPPPMEPIKIPNKVKVTRGPDGKLKVERAPEPRGRGGAESRKAEDGRRSNAKETSRDRKEAAANTARVGVNVEKAIQDMINHFPGF